MRIRFVDLATDTPLDRRVRVERRLRLVVGRRAPRVSLMEVSLVCEPSSGAKATRRAEGACRCRIRARLIDGDTVVVDEHAHDLDAAVEVATWRLDRRLDRPSSRASA